ncbi:hypothetical protein WL78_00495 [Burkholderia ubonensis]|uniref:hypothetical protein n=1 Tax=Burkholderia ubonensis TaxID=101571 RepID=UPI00075E8BD7|nr:hypothetical protein [Burkholderia ubonensis]KWE77274.1 hypothetical protein WL78_00495 [Burkholderia ubonensis]
MKQKPGPVWATITWADDPRAFLLAVMNSDADTAIRIEAAAALMPYHHEMASCTAESEGRGD